MQSICLSSPLRLEAFRTAALNAVRPNGEGWQASSLCSVAFHRRDRSAKPGMSRGNWLPVVGVLDRCRPTDTTGRCQHICQTCMLAAFGAMHEYDQSPVMTPPHAIASPNTDGRVS